MKNEKIFAKYFYLAHVYWHVYFGNTRINFVVAFSQNPVQAYGLSFIFSVSGYLGITFVLTLIKAFGALLAVTGKLKTCTLRSARK